MHLDPYTVITKAIPIIRVGSIIKMIMNRFQNFIDLKIGKMGIGCFLLFSRKVNNGI